MDMKTLGMIGALALGLTACLPKTEEANTDPAAPMGDMKMDDMPATPAAPPTAGPIMGTGKVTAVDAAAGTVALDHQPIPAVGWGAMSMTFTTTDLMMLKDLKVGDAVSFELKSASETTIITKIQKQ